MTENIFQKGCLVQMSVSKWGGVKKIDKSKLSNMVDQAEYDWVTATKKLVDPESLKPICKINNFARNWLTTISLPFPITGMVFVPKDLINCVDEKLGEFKIKFNEAVQDFIQDYSWLRETAKTYLGDLFNEIDYPVDIGGKFNFNWRFIILDVPNGDTRLLAPEVYAREKEKFIQTMEEARGMAIDALREEFAQMVERITDRFVQNENGKSKIFKNTTVESFYDYFQTFKDRNIFQDHELTTLVNRAQAVLNGSNVEQIRSSDNLKENIRSGMTDIENTLTQIFNRPRRKIVID
ncbi:hypothetical protein HN903_02490 [archaeon]|jgi:hypothetical protein|nr:hypothetical protein [archaeon]MBT7128600.1 hypothetical protein [archaeon]